MSAKKIHSSSVTGQQGINLIEYIVLGMGYLWYPSGGVEAGIDGYIEIREPATGVVRNSIVQVQSKAGVSFFQAETENSFEYRCSERDLNYWLQGNAPVILVVSRPESNEAYWVSVKDHFRDLSRRRARKVRFDKERDRFDEGCGVALAKLAVPPDAGLYFAPLPKEETLYSNLLKVSYFPKRLYVAQTDYRTGREVWAKLVEMDAREDTEWLAKHKSILGFKDLSEWPWNEICDQGAVEAFDSEEWAYSDDPDKEREFVQLLNRCLSAKVRTMGLRYSKDLDCYYFKPSRDLSERKLSYHGIANDSTRTVFCGYSKKGKPDEIAYYRHSAFRGRFKRFGDDWYLEITPTYFYTWDGRRLDRFYEDRLKGIKQREKHQAVRGQLVMWTEFLSRNGTLLDAPYSLLEFDELLKVTIEAGIDDDAWARHDEEHWGADHASGLGLFE